MGLIKVKWRFGEGPDGENRGRLQRTVKHLTIERGLEPLFTVAVSGFWSWECSGEWGRGDLMSFKVSCVALADSEWNHRRALPRSLICSFDSCELSLGLHP